MTKLLCATDLLPKSESAIQRAALLAEGLGAKLSLLHVVSPHAPQGALEETLRTAITDMRSRVRPPTWRAKLTASAGVLVGNPKRLIVGSLVRENPDLLVIGPHRERNEFDLSQDTLAEKVVNARKCPVLVVQREANTAYRKVLLALDTSTESRTALHAAERLGLTDSTQTAIVYARSVPQTKRSRSISALPSYMESNEAEHIAESMREFLTRESMHPERYELIVTEGRPAAAIARTVKTYQPDLLIVGSRGHGQLGRAVASSVVNRLLKNTHCDILIVPRNESFV